MFFHIFPSVAKRISRYELSNFLIGIDIQLTLHARRFLGNVLEYEVSGKYFIIMDPL